ncbi:DUF4326 domain-containing protein [Pseudonocardia sp.]|uniref:DUF4326 domain-containing protein n=1 Tax=Pseudonocardia sp. TaxID=60912 RepID=UPI003D0B937A
MASSVATCRCGVLDEHDTAAPFRLREYGRAEAVARHREWLLADPERVAEVRRELRGRDLACWCPTRPCTPSGAGTHRGRSARCRRGMHAPERVFEATGRGRAPGWAS